MTRSLLAMFRSMRLQCLTRARNRGCVGVSIFLFMVFVIMMHGDQELNKTQSVLVTLNSLKTSLDLTYNTSTTVLQPMGPNMCKNNGSEHYMLMMFITSPHDEADRNYLRKNFKAHVAKWEEYILRSRGAEYKAGEVLKMLFFVGMPDKEDAKEQLITEWESHGDMIFDDFQETYLNLTLKTVRMLKWVQTFCADVKYLLKVDGDVYFNMKKLVNFLESLDELSAKHLIAGHVYNSIKADTNYNSKWYTPPSVYQGRLPSFVAGFFYVLGSTSRSRLFDEVFKTAPFHLEDVFLTGFVRNSTDLKTVNIIDIRVFWTYADRYKPSCFLNNYVAVHPVPAYKLACWAQFSKSNFRCSRWPIISYC